MALRRIEPGLYRTDDGETEIRKEESVQTRRAPEICWQVYHQGKHVGFAKDTFKEAKELAKQRGFI
jgi:hypothetical protein